MTALTFLAFALALALYVAASAAFFGDVARLQAPAPGQGHAAAGATPAGRAPLFLSGAALAHAAYVALVSFAVHACPVYSTPFLSSFASLLATAGFLALRSRLRLHALGVFLAPLGAVFLASTFFLVQSSGAMRSRLAPAFVVTHVLANLAGTALFLLACGGAVLYLVQERRLKQKRLVRAAGGLPPIDALDRAVHRLLLAGFPLLTLGLVTGTLWTHDLVHGSADQILRAVLGYLTWLVAALVLTLRAAAGWRGRRAAYGTIAGFLCAAAVLAVYLARPMLSGGG